MEWSEIWKLVSELAFRETGRAILWLIIGSVLGLVLSALAVSVCRKLTKKVGLFPKDSFGVWGRRVFLVVFGFVTAGILMSNGALWGLFVAAEKTVVSQQLVEKAFQEAVTPVLRDSLEKIDSEDEGGRGAQLSLVNDELSAKELLAEIEGIEKEAVSWLWTKIAEAFRIGDSEAESKVPVWMKSLVGKSLLKLTDIEGVSFAEVLDQLGEVVTAAQARDEKGDDLVTVEELAWSMGSVMGVPWVKAYSKTVRSGLLLGAGIQFVGTSLLVFLIFWGGSWGLRSLLGKSREESE